ncbi:efflux RND transporter periplasmic adaptor subunit [Massilia sp. W12]|uniref:efflux RND transporter periplasmic adaptor subunit n=1 Tax=Massilia sp. W12 TaxID=3126507 RepID=UPI0030CF3755
MSKQTPFKPAAWLSLLAAGLLLSACQKPAAPGPGPAQMPPPDVNVVQAKLQALPNNYEYPGQSAGAQETEVRARVSGIIEQRLYEEGARVAAGAPLFKLDADNYRNQYQTAQANLSLAEARQRQARREFERLQPLLQDKAVSQKEADDAKSALEIAEAGLLQARAQAADAKLNLERSTITAPVAGVTGVALKSNGNLVGPNDVLTTLVQTDPMHIHFTLPESDWLSLQREAAAQKIVLPGARAKNGSLPFTVQIKLADGSLYARSGKMNFTSEKINPAHGGFEARAEIPNPDGVLRPGQFVRVLLQGAQRAQAIAVPQRAVIDGPMGKMVFVVGKDNKLQPRPVQVDGWQQGLWVVTKGLQDGDMVMADGVIKAHIPGMPVKPHLIPLQAAPGAPAAAAPASAAASAKASVAASAAH